MADDPRELARRLAEEAKAKLKSQDEDPRELARRLAEEAKRKASQGGTGPAADVPPPGKLSAKEALELERQRRREREAAPPSAPAPPPRPAAAPTDATLSNETTSPGGAGSVVGVIQAALPGASVVFRAPVTQVEVARALWQSHLARARQEGDPQLVTTATVLLDALGRVPRGQLVAVRATVGGQDWAFWVDDSRQTLVATAFPAEVYLAGL